MGLPLRIEGLSVTNARGRVLLAVESLSLPAGALVGVRGPSGAGKSTLLYAVGGLVERAAGQVHWGETDMLRLAPEARARFRADHMGMIFQDFLLFEELNALQNASLTAMFRPRAERKTLAARASDHLTRLGLALSPRAVASFSGGERQRVAIARALTNDAKILLADEPTASLPREAADRLIEDLTALARKRGKTMVAVSHDVHLLDRMDRVLTIRDGRLAEEAAG
jgi:ABC-type lipoprotein export system ATPase subunit